MTYLLLGAAAGALAVALSPVALAAIKRVIAALTAKAAG